MAQEYQIDEAQQVVWVRCSGTLSDNDITAHQAALRTDPRFRPTQSQLVDTTAVTDVTLSLGAVKKLGQSTLFAPESKRAYVVTKDVIFGLVRMYELYQTLRGSRSVRVFRTRAEAIGWLAVKDTSSS